MQLIYPLNLFLFVLFFFLFCLVSFSYCLFISLYGKLDRHSKINCHLLLVIYIYTEAAHFFFSFGHFVPIIETSVSSIPRQAYLFLPLISVKFESDFFFKKIIAFLFQTYQKLYTRKLKTLPVIHCVEDFFFKK